MRSVTVLALLPAVVFCCRHCCCSTYWPQVSAWLCTVMAVGFFTANLATEKLQGSLYVNFFVTSIGTCATCRAVVF